jgi:hypothetical protein
LVVSFLAGICLPAACGEEVVVAERDAGGGDADSDGDADGDADADGDSDSETGTASCDWQWAQLGLLSSVWGRGPGEIYAVGGSTLTDSLAFRFDGASWQALPDPGTVAPMGMMDVWGFAEGGLVAISDWLVALHFDGLAWTTSSTVSANASLRGVWGAGAGEIWAVGGILDTVVLRYDGGGWTKTPVADLPAVGPLAAVWGDASGETVAVGNGAILRFDGQEWTAMDTAEVLDSYLTVFRNAWGLSVSDLFVVGQHGLTFDGVVLRYDGQDFEQADLGPAAEGAALRGVHGSGPEDVWVVGARDGAGVVLRFDGSAWSEIDGPFTFPLNEVWVAAPDRIFAVGESGAVWCQ